MSAFTHALSTNNYGEFKFIVSATASLGTHTTITLATAAASSGDTIYIRDGTYTENFTPKDGVTYASFGAMSEEPNYTASPVIIVGKLSDSGAINCNFIGIEFQTNSDNIFSLSAASTFSCFGCVFRVNHNVAAWNMSNSSANIKLWNCRGNLNSASATYYSITTGDLWLYGGLYTNGSGSTTAPTFSGGIITMFYTQFNAKMSATSTAYYDLNYVYCNTSSINSICLTTAGTGEGFARFCHFMSGSAASLSIGSGTTMNVVHANFNSSTTNVTTGAGTMKYAFLSYTGTSSGNNVSTSTALSTR